MKAADLDSAIALLCERFDCHCDVEILLVGGAAGMLTGVLGPERTTIDCDVIDYEPAAAWTEIESLAAEIGKELGLPDRWLNSNVQIRLDCLPDNWKSRRQLILSGNRLLVYAISRLDLIAMKFMAHRRRDLEDLGKLAVTSDDVEFVRKYLQNLPEKGTRQEQILEAVEVLNSWTTSK